MFSERKGEIVPFSQQVPVCKVETGYRQTIRVNKYM